MVAAALMASAVAGRKKKRVSRFDGESGTESPPREDDKPVDNSGALVSYRSEPLNLDFRNYLNSLTAEPCVEDSYGVNMYGHSLWIPISICSPTS